jgi:DNA replication protein DnaC
MLTAMRSIAHQMKSARFPMHRDLAGFDFAVSQVDQRLIKKLAGLSFTQDAQNVVLVGGPGNGKIWPRRWASRLDPARQAGALH